MRKPTLKHILLRLEILLIVVCFVHTANAQSDTLSKKYHSFRLKTDVAQWFCQNPNLEVEYRFSKKIAVNVSVINLKRGYVWPWKIITYGKKSIREDNYEVPSGKYKNIMERWPLYGYLIKLEMKYYLAKNYYISPLLYYKNESYKDFTWGFLDNTYREDLAKKNYGVGIMFGREGRRRKYTFGEWFVGVGLKYSTEEKTKYVRVSPGDHFIATESKSAKILPSLFFGYNIGIRMGNRNLEEGKTKNFREFPKNSIYGEIMGTGMLVSINYERQLFNRNCFYLNTRIGSGFLPDGATGGIRFLPFLIVNCQFQFSNCCSFETGLGIRLDLLSYYTWKEIPALTSDFCFRYNGPHGYLFRVGLMPDIIPKRSYGLLSFQPGMSIGYCFGK